MKYISTRGSAPILDFEDVLLAGLARDGGLYLPETWPQFSDREIANLAGHSYAELAQTVMWPYVENDFARAEFSELVHDAYDQFSHQAVAPLVQLESNLWLLELFHGPTLAFKDFAMQVLSRLMDHILKRRKSTVTIIGATSGDTGSAAIDAFKGRDAIDIFILYPHGRVSDVQRRQMTTVNADNVFTIALEGTFDDCQSIVKELFNRHEFRDEVRLTGVNSINWARIMAQTAYYFSSAVSLGAPYREVSYSVPTGNFGDVFAGYAAKQMGLNISALHIATNVNDILVRALDSGSYRPQTVIPTRSPSMDIQISSNFERLLFENSGRDSTRIIGLMKDLADNGAFELSQNELKPLRELFSATSIGEAETLDIIDAVYRKTGYLVDPHTAVGLGAARQNVDSGGTPVIALATAHPAKFPETIEATIGRTPDIPEQLIHQQQSPEEFSILENNPDKVIEFIREHARHLEAVPQ